MKYVLLLILTIIMIISYQSGMLNVNAISSKDIKNHLQGIDEHQLLGALESLKTTGIDEQWLQGIDEHQLLGTLESLKTTGIDEHQLLGTLESLKTTGIDEHQLLGALESLKTTGIDEGINDSGGYGGGFILILVLFILLVIIGAGFGGGDAIRSDENQVPLADAQDGGFIPLVTVEP